MTQLEQAREPTRSAMNDRRTTTPERIHSLLDHWVRETPDRAFILLTDHSQVTFAELARMTDVLEQELRELAVGEGDRVLVVAENCPEHAALILACSRVGAWSCGVNARMSNAEIDAFADRADPKILYFTSGASDMAMSQAERHAARPSIVPALRHAPGRAGSAPDGSAGQHDVTAMIFTSGTTGQPKGVMLTHDALLHFARVSSASRQLGPQDISYAFVPMTHIFGLGTVLLSSLAAGSQMLMRPRFEPADLLDALATKGLTQLQGPPALYSRLLAHMQQHGVEHPSAPALRYVYTGAGPLDLSLKRRVERAFGQTLHHGYGLSEYAGSVHLTRLGDNHDDTRAGYVVPEAELRVADPVTHAPMPPGQRGEIWIRGRGLMPGYFRDPAATAAVMRDGGWYASGDLGELHEDGALFVVGRLKEMIIRSGFNVYPAEIENVLNHHHSTQRSAVVGVPESDGNETIVAYVELRPGATLDEPALKALLRERLAPYKQPSRIVALDELPSSHNGKILKRVLKERPVRPRADESTEARQTWQNTSPKTREQEAHHADERADPLSVRTRCGPLLPAEVRQLPTAHLLPTRDLPALRLGVGAMGPGPRYGHRLFHIGHRPQGRGRGLLQRRPDRSGRGGPDDGSRRRRAARLGADRPARRGQRRE